MLQIILTFVLIYLVYNKFQELTKGEDQMTAQENNAEERKVNPTGEVETNQSAEDEVRMSSIDDIKVKTVSLVEKEDFKGAKELLDDLIKIKKTISKQKSRNGVPYILGAKVGEIVGGIRDGLFKR